MLKAGRPRSGRSHEAECVTGVRPAAGSGSCGGPSRAEGGWTFSGLRGLKRRACLQRRDGHAARREAVCNRAEVAGTPVGFGTTATYQGRVMLTNIVLGRKCPQKELSGLMLCTG